MSKGQPENSNLDDSAVMVSITSQWWSFSAFVPLLTGALWVWLASRSGLPAVLLGAVPGALLLGTGLSSLIWDTSFGDRQAREGDRTRTGHRNGLYKPENRARKAAT